MDQEADSCLTNENIETDTKPVLTIVKIKREKSLSLLCHKFLSFYPTHVEPDQQIIVCLDKMAQYLGKFFIYFS